MKNSWLLVIALPVVVSVAELHATDLKKPALVSTSEHAVEGILQSAANGVSSLNFIANTARAFLSHDDRVKVLLDSVFQSTVKPVLYNSGGSEDLNTPSFTASNCQSISC